MSRSFDILNDAPNNSFNRGANSAAFNRKVEGLIQCVRARLIRASDCYRVMKLKIAAIALLVMSLTLLVRAQRVEKPSYVSGRITTLWGAPIEQAQVSFYKLKGFGGISPTEKLAQRVTTGKDGKYKATVSHGEYRVEVITNGQGKTEVWRFYLGDDDNRILDIGVPLGNWHFVSRMKVSGVVRQPDGTPVRDATVTMIPAYSYNEPQTFVSFQGRTDAQGRYDFVSLEVGDFVVYVAKPGFLPDSAAFRLNNGEEKTVDIELKVAPQFEFLPKHKK